MAPRLSISFSIPIAAMALAAVTLAGCHVDADRRAEAARPPDSTQAPPPLAIDAATPGTEAAEASGVAPTPPPPSSGSGAVGSGAAHH